MTKIIDLVNFHSSIGEQVRLLEYFYSEDQNRAHMEGYVPIRSHRAAFMELARAQLPDVENKEKVFMLTGSFGTGKSHLCLMLANYLSLKPTDFEMQAFFENWNKSANRRNNQSQDNSVETIRNWRGGGRYLVAPCEFGEARPFEDMVITAIERALDYEGAQEIILDTHFKSALRQIEQWEQRLQAGEPSGVYEDFLTYLGGDDPRQESEELKRCLAENDSSAMELFQDTYQKATGQRLSFRNDSLLAILRDLLTNPEFHARYKGLVILADEFGYALTENRVSLSVFQGFAEMSKDGIDGMQLIFIGTGHRRFSAYGDNTQMQLDFRVVQDRVTEVSLESEELEQIIAALVSPKTEEEAWQIDVIEKNGWLLSSMASGAKKLRMFDYLSEPELRDDIVTNIFPVHPMATYCLTKLSQELGSDARSVFAFFRKYGEPEPEGGYRWFVLENEVIQPNGILNIYTPDILARYFSQDIKTSNLNVRLEVRDYIRNYKAAVDEAEKFAFKNSLSRALDPFTKKVLDLIFVYRGSNVNVVPQTLEFGLNLQRPDEKRRLTSELNSLEKNKIIFKSPSGEYEFRRSDMADLDTLINDERQDLLQQPVNYAFELVHLAMNQWEPWTEALGHNRLYVGDKRALRMFVTPQELVMKYKLSDGSEVSFWEYYELRRQNLKGWNDRYDGIMVYVLCDTDTDIKAAQQAVKSNRFETIITGIPRNPIPVKDTILDVLAVKKFKEGEKFSKLDFQEKALADEIFGKENQKTGRIGSLISIRERYLDARELYWYRDDGKTHLAEPTSEYDPVDALMNRLFNKRNQVSHDYLSKAHPKTFPGAKDSPLREAVDKLINLDKPVQIDSGEKENRGEIRYLKMALADYSVLIQVSDYDGKVAQFELESNLDKIRYYYPALVALIEEIKAVQPGESINIWPVLSNLTDPPYGLGPYSLSIFCACAFRHFGDELRLKVNPTGWGYSPTNDPEIIIDIATGKFPLATIERRSITPATAKLINEIYNLFSEIPATAGEQQSLSETWRAMATWWKNRTSLERTVGIYSDDSTALKLVDTLSKLSTDNAASQIFLEEIKQVYDYSQDAELDESSALEIARALLDDKSVIENRAKAIKSTLVNSLAQLFNPRGDTYDDYREAILAWYRDLHPDQKILSADWQSPASRSVLEAIQTMQDVVKTFLEIIPAAPGFRLGKVDDWSYDRTSNYLNVFKDALTKIESSLPKVPVPLWETSQEPAVTYQGVPQIKYRGDVKLVVQVPTEDTSVRVTKDEDPRAANQFVTVDKASSWEEKINRSCSYLLVSQNEQGEFSKVIRLTFTNLDEANKLIAETAAKLEAAERIYRFRNPVDKPGLLVLLRDMIDWLISDGCIPKNEILAAFNEAPREILEEKSQDNKQ